MTQPSFAVVDLSLLGSNTAERALEIGVVLLDPQLTIERCWGMAVALEQNASQSGKNNLNRESTPTFRNIAWDLATLLRGRILVAKDIDLVCRTLRDQYANLGVKLPLGRFGVPVADYDFEATQKIAGEGRGDYLDEPDVYCCAASEDGGGVAALQAAQQIASSLRGLGPRVLPELSLMDPLRISAEELVALENPHLRCCAPVAPADGGSPFTRGDFAQFFPWFSGPNSEVEEVVLQWISEYASAPLYKLSPMLNPMVLPDGFDTKTSYVQRWLARFPKPLYASVADVLAAQVAGRRQAEALVRNLVFHVTRVGFAQHHPAEFPHPLPAADLIAGWLDLHGQWFEHQSVTRSRGCFPKLLVEAVAQHPNPAAGIYERAVAEILRVVDQDPCRHHRVLEARAGGRATLQELATGLGVTRERARQIEARVKEKIRKDGEYSKVLASAIVTRFYPCARVDTIFQAIPELAEPIDPRLDCTLFDVLCWLYARHGVPNSIRASVRWEVSNQWFICDEFEPLVISILKTLGGQFGIIKTETLLGQLRRRSKAIYTDEILVFVLDRHNYKERSDVLIPRTQSIAEMVGVELTLRGEPMTVKQLRDRMPHRTHASIGSALSASENFFRCAPDTWALRGWNREEWTTLPDLLARRIAKRGGEAPFDWLVDQAAAFGVAKTSTVAYLRGAGFIIDAHNMVRVNERQPECKHIPELSRGMYRGDHAWMQLVTVTFGHLRGSSTAIPQAVINVYGLELNKPAKIPSRLGPQVIRWSRTHCMLGTVRRFLLELGCKPGDRVFLVFGETFDVQPAAAADAKLRGKRAVLNEMGLEVQPGENPFVTINKALGLPSDAVRTLAIERLKVRGEKALAEKLRWA